MDCPWGQDERYCCKRNINIYALYQLILLRRTLVAVILITWNKNAA